MAIAVGDPGMRKDGLRLAIEAWNQCNEVGEKVPHVGSLRAAECFDIYKASQSQEVGPLLRGRFYGSWDLDADLSKGLMAYISYYSITWEKEIGMGSWIFHHVLRTSTKYPWLMLYLRSDATYGLSGGYYYPTRGMSEIVSLLISPRTPNQNIFRQSLDLQTIFTIEIPESSNFKVRFTLNVIKGGGPSSQFYLIDIGSCWKNNGQQCDGDTTSDVTRYHEMIIYKSERNWMVQCKQPQYVPSLSHLPHSPMAHACIAAKLLASVMQPITCIVHLGMQSSFSPPSREPKTQPMEKGLSTNHWECRLQQ
ncbi:hypothetical protein REPUB_Repub13aG0225800 [Reevesia pubescens]